MTHNNSGGKMNEIHLSEKDIKPKKLKERIKAFFANPKKRLIFIIIASIVLIGSAAAGFYFYTRILKNAVKTDTSSKSETPATTAKYQAVLDGVMTTDNDAANKHPLGIIVENHPDARPQSGLDKASIVYEAIAEGGITRFLALYGTNEAEKVGPVRSARTYFVDWAEGFNAYLAHVGGNMDALEKIVADRVLSLDQFRYSSPYHREYSTGLASEHTMYTSTILLRQQAETNKYSSANNFNVLKFKDDADNATLPNSQIITVNFSSAEYQVVFNYNKETNSYDRSLAGKPHIDAITKKQLSPKNVIVMTETMTPTITRINEPGYIMKTIGSGKAKIFFDGVEADGSWKKDASGNRDMFFDTNGAEITFDRGQFWICVIPPTGSITVQ